MIKFKKIIYLSLIMFSFLLIGNSQYAFAEDGEENSGYGFKAEVVKDSENTLKKEDAANKLYDQGKIVVAGLSGLCALTLFVLFVVKAGSLSASANNPAARQSAIMGMLCIGIGFALLGSFSLFMIITSGIFT